MLVLFDVDGTLLLTQRAGVLAMLDAGRELFGDGFTFEGVEFAGRLDPLIWYAAAQRNRIGDADDQHERFRAAYGRHLERRFQEHPTASLLPGVREIVERLHEHEDIALGLLTGNYAETGRMKIRAAGLDPAMFTVAVWGDEAGHRRDLVPLALARYEQLKGRSIESEQVIVIGDTPHDVDCAHANGCRVIAVATGPSYSMDDLRSHQPDLLVEDLSDVEGIVGWIMQPNPIAER